MSSVNECGSQLSFKNNHASTEITEKHYIQHQRENFDPALRLPMLPVLARKKAARKR